MPVDEEWFVKTISGKHNDDLVSVLFPNGHERGVKFLDDKEALFRRFLTSLPYLVCFNELNFGFMHLLC